MLAERTTYVDTHCTSIEDSQGMSAMVNRAKVVPGTAMVAEPLDARQEPHAATRHALAAAVSSTPHLPPCHAGRCTWTTQAGCLTLLASGAWWT